MVENKEHSQYEVKIDGSVSLTLRNSSSGRDGMVETAAPTSGIREKETFSFVSISGVSGDKCHKKRPDRQTSQ